MLLGDSRRLFENPTRFSFENYMYKCAYNQDEAGTRIARIADAEGWAMTADLRMVHMNLHKSAVYF